MNDIINGILLPFAGTSTGAACVFFMRGGMNKPLQRILTGFAGGVMVAASVWSLLIPAIESSGNSAVPAFIGFWFGVAFLFSIDKFVPDMQKTDGISAMTALAVTIHNIPEGMAVGVVYAGLIAGTGDITAISALTLSIGIAIQNFPEGAIVSMPLRANGMTVRRAFLYGVLSGVVEPVGAAATILLIGIVTPALPYLLSFAAGAMMYVVVNELIPEFSSDEGTIMFTLGFTIMMALDIALG